MDKTLLKNCSVIDENGDLIGKRDILISGGSIEKISSESIKVKNTEVLDCEKYFITSGFANLHTHSPMNIFKGIAEDVDEDKWFNQEIWPYESKMDGEDVYAGCKLAIAEMLHYGVTAFADHYFEAEMICKAVLETGIRGDIAPTLFGMAGGFNKQLDQSVSLINRYNSVDNRLKLRFGPHSPYTCSPDELKKTAEAARDLNVGIHLHVSDAEAQIQTSIDKYGKTPFQVISDGGLFDVPLIIGHGLWILEEEKSLISDRTWFAVCPKSYMKLSAGTGRIWQLYKELPLCIGTDGAASSNSLDPLEQARLFAMIGKLVYNNAEDYTLKETWKILMRGHEALDFNSGRVQEGAAADLLFWDLDNILTLPVYNPLGAILYSAGADQIVHSMIDGQFVKKNGRVNLDLDEIRNSAKKRADLILKKGKGKTKLLF